MRISIYIIAIFSFISVKATNYYVSNSGSDSNNGTSPSSAWATPGKITELAQTGDVFDPGDSIFFERGGLYRGVMSGEYLSASYFGTYGSGDLPVLTGLVEITDTWQKVSGNIWKVSSSAISEKDGIKFLFKNDASLPLGRYPNNEYMTFQIGVGLDQIKDFTSEWENNYWQGAECVLKSSRWTIDALEVESQIDGTITFAEESTYELDDVNGWGYFYQNHPNALDKEGEWCFYNSEIYVYSASDPNSSTYEFSYYDNAIYTFNTGQLNHKVQNISFIGYNLDCIKFELFANGTGSHFEIIGNSFASIGESGIDIAFADGLLIKNNTFTNMVNNGIDYYECENTEVSYNTLTNIGMIPGRGGDGNGAYQGITQSAGSNHVIKNNTLINIGYNAISFFGANGTIIKNNYVNGSCLIKDDGGGIYTWNAPPTYGEDMGHKIIDNIVRNVPGSNDGVGGEEAAHLAAYAIYIDDRKDDIEITGNILFDSEYGIFIHHSRDIDISRNIIYNCDKGILMRQYQGVAIYDCDVYSNIIVNMNETASAHDNYSMDLYASSLADYIPANNNFDTNYYISPFLYSDYITTSDGSVELTYNLDRWNTMEGHGANSKIEPLKWHADSGVDKSEFVLFDYALESAKEVFLLGEFVDVDGNKVSGEVDLQPYTGIILLKTSNGKIVSDLSFSGSEAVCYDTDTSDYVAVSSSYDSYQWRLAPDSAGTIVADGLTASIVWNKNYKQDVKLYLHGCKGGSCSYGSQPFEIEKLATPIPDFEINKLDKVVSFTNYSENYDNVVWYFGDTGTSDKDNPIHKYVLDTTYTVTMTVSNAGCQASKSDTVRIFTEVPVDTSGNVIAQDVDAFALPNVFTPNGDGENEAWDVTNIFLEYPKAEIRIYNRAYKLVKILNVSELQWDGKDENGNLLPTGNYMYIIDFKDDKRPIKRYIAILR